MRVAVALSVFLVLLGCPILRPTSAALVLEHESVPFRFVPAHFGPAINSTGICGAVHVADPLDGCTPLRNSLESNETEKANFVVIARDKCYYIDKIRHAQNAGFAAAIVDDDQLDGDLVTMDANSQGINVHAVFVSKIAGEFLKLYAQVQEGDCCIIPPDTSDDFDWKDYWTVMGIYAGSGLSFISVTIALIIYAPGWWDWCCQRRSCSRVNIDSRTAEASPRVDPVTVQAFPRLETTTVLAHPRFTFWSGHQSNSIVGETCAICLEDYREGESINALPCKHEFHSRCMASWLTKGGTLCPVCRRDMRTHI